MKQKNTFYFGDRDKQINTLMQGLSQKQKDTILAHDKAITAKNINSEASIRFVNCLSKYGRHIKKTFEDVTAEDIQDFFNNYEFEKGKKWYYINIPRFHKWIHKQAGGKGYPKCVEWITDPDDGIKGRFAYEVDHSKKLVDVERYKKMLKYAGSNRDRAIIAVLLDTAARPIELCRCTCGDYDKVNNTLTLRSKKKIKGKITTRKVGLVNSIPYMQRYFDEHVFKDDDDKPLFYGMSSSNRPFRPLNTSGIRVIWKNAQRNAGYTDILPLYRARHTRLTELGTKLKSAELKTYAGWTSVMMADTYCDIKDEDVNKKLLKIYGKEVKDKEGKVTLMLQPRQCPFCLTDNPHDADFCSECKRAISVQSVEAQQQEQQSLKDEVAELRALVLQAMGKDKIKEKFERGEIKVG